MTLSRSLGKVAPVVRRYVRMASGVAAVLAILSVILSFPHDASAGLQPPWSGFYFCPDAKGVNNDHQLFLTEFREMVEVLKTRGINTIVFDMNYRSYRFQDTDSRLDTYAYPAYGGFTKAETATMARIARENGMQVMVAFQVLTHSVGNVFNEVYPEYMLKPTYWQAGVSYKAGRYVEYQVTGVTRRYKCTADHLSALGNAPPSASYWKESTLTTRDPFNADGEQLVFRMVDELVQAFTVDDVKPEGFHIESDELLMWYDTPEQTTGMTSAQIYAMAINNAYRHIKANHPTMEVIMWGDMLDPEWNGSAASKNTWGATDLIAKDVIVADWRYQQSGPGYDVVRKKFASVGQFVDKGFRVWPTSWADVGATTDLVWTENLEQARTGKVMGHMYSTWLSGIVPELTFLLLDPAYVISDAVLVGIAESDKPRFRGYYRGIADSINAISASNLIGLQQCRGTEYSCGTYPNCDEVARYDGNYGSNYGSEFRTYSCVNNESVYTVTNFPGDYVSFWRLNGSAADASGVNNGTLVNGAGFVYDAEIGQVASFAGTADYISVNDHPSLDFGTGDYSLSLWMKTPFLTTPSTGWWPGIFVKGASASAYAHTWGFLQTPLKNNAFVYTESTNSGGASAVSLHSPALSNGWHHVTMTRSGTTVRMYLDGQYISQSDTGGTDLNNDYPVFFGRDKAGGTNNASKFRLDDVMVYKRVLSPAEVRQIYLSTGAGTKAPITNISPAPGVYLSARDVTLACTDRSGSGCAATYYCLGTGCSPTSLYSCPVNLSASTEVTFYSTDGSGNSETFQHGSYDIAYPPNDYLSYWNFDGDTLDVTGKNNGTPINGAGIVNDAERGLVANFAGPADYISVADDPSLDFGTMDYSLSLWMKIPFATTPPAGWWPGIFVKGGSASANAHTWGFLQNSLANDLFIYTQSTDSGGASAFTLRSPELSNGWHHVTVTRSGTTVRMYLDGQYLTQSANGGTDLTNDQPVFFGRDKSGGTYGYSKGGLDDIMVHRRSLSAAEIQALYNSSGGGDRVPPTTAVDPAPETFTSSLKVTLTCTDGSGSGCAETFYCIEAGCSPTTLYTAPIVLSTSTELSFYSKDRQGNSEAIQSKSYTQVVPAPYFDLVFTAAEGTGSGWVVSIPSGISCGSGCSGTFASGTLVTLSATAANDSNFVGWSGGCNGTQPCSISLTGPTDVSATFVKKTVSLTISVTDGVGGTVTVDKASAPYGESATFTVTPFAGYLLSELTDNGQSVDALWNPSGSCTYTVTNLTSDHNVVATFAP